MEENFQIIQPALIAETLMHNAEIIKQFIALYESQIPVDFTALEEAIKQEIHTEIASATHHIKPTMSYIGAITIKEKLEQLEELAKKNSDIITIRQHHELVKDDYHVLIEEISRYAKSLN